MEIRPVNDRYSWFHERMERQATTTVADFMAYGRMSRREALRDVNDMKLMHNAPISYNRQRRSYEYTDAAFRFSGEWIGEEEMIGLVVAKRLAAAIPDKARKNEIHKLFAKIYARHGDALRRLEDKVSLKNICYYRVQPEVFNLVLRALHRECKLAFNYYPVFDKPLTQRTVSPLHMVLYRGNWQLVAFCELRQEQRMFTLSRMQDVRMLGDQAAARQFGKSDIHAMLESVHGIFISDKPIWVALRFSAKIARFAAEQVWHERQELATLADGKLTIRFPVGDYPEVIQEILGYGPEIEVLEPAALRREVASRIAAMHDIYRFGSAQPAGFDNCR